MIAEQSRPRSYSQQNPPTLTHSHPPPHRPQPPRPSSAALQSSLPGYGLIHPAGLIPHSLMIPTVYAFNQQLASQQHHHHHHHQQQFFLHAGASFPDLAHPPLAMYSGPPNRSLNSSSPILGPPSAPPLTRSAHSDHFTPGSATAVSSAHHRHPSPSLHPSHHHRSQSRSLSNPGSTSTSTSAAPAPATLASSALCSQIHHSSPSHHPMYAPRPSPGAHSDPASSASPSPSPRIANGSSGLPLPRPRTQSTQSDRSRPVSHHGPAQKSLSTTNAHRLRTDSNHSTTSHGFSSGPSAALVKPLGSLNEPQFTFNHSSPPTARSATATTNLSSSSIPPSGSIQGRPSSPSTHSFSSPNPPVGNNMVRRSSPLAQSNLSHHPSTPQPAPADPAPRQPTTTTTTTTPTTTNNSYSSSASYRNSSASTVTITSAPPPVIPASITVAGPNQHDEEVEEDSDTTSDVDHRPPGHRSTPGTSVDSSTSNFTQPEDASSATGSPAFPDRTPHKHSKHSLSNKLRRALSINALHENMIHESIPELGPVIGHERLKSSSASIAGVPLSPSITTKVKAGRQSGSSRRFGFLNSKSNSSTDNLSISSTVSSASVMIRKLGNLGKSARTKGVMGLTKIFRDKSEAAAAGESTPDDGNGFSTKQDRFKKTSSPNQHKNLASTSVAQVQAEVDRSLSVEFPGMTPAAAFIHKQKQQYAEQEAAAAAAAASAAENQARVPDSVRSKGRAGSIGSASSMTPGSASEARKKMIEKEKEKIKSKKSRKWGFAGLGGSGTSSEDLPVSPSVEDLRRPAEHQHASDVEDNEEWDENTVRGANIEGLIDSCIGNPLKSVEELRGDDDDPEALDEYDMESLFGNAPSTEGSSSRRAGLRPRPSKEAVPKKGILKNAQNFSQEQHLSPGSFQSKPISAATTPDSPQPRALAEDPATAATGGLLPQLGKPGQGVGAAIDFGSAGPNLSLAIAGTEVSKDRRATFAQHLSVHTTWPPAIYDRRGELATCNRLTPTLAQRIKEEINAFKMEEMEVHYASRVHTHFFV
ncbi:hypothetical protein, variant 2 [Puccinia triticina 1-1 BBBD Race 1]|uniref:Uncharacterized protein n=1 Tax=Puccinia triticina (isolate 1-1 / race 1 (BBBD)) TaxID=630390 RepID=A0A180GXS5_PUCT1|nr:hypothetical protein PTTG_26123 [Puccinia triticina 1-1 BBBD Race 1]OAV97312.1 hypothetical protein, variant 1 [Puccinia triticina 1-1 BBBD Race 1]OAV97313.1 hypothetical protein, variant 2 [Puccinia triticina 1-1 BBBD Race 1]